MHSKVTEARLLAASANALAPHGPPCAPRAGRAVFYTRWCVESLAIEALVIFIIRTAHRLRDGTHPALLASALWAVVVAVSYPRFAHGIGFVPLPATVLGALALVTAAYLVSVYAAKRFLFEHHKLDQACPAVRRVDA